MDELSDQERIALAAHAIRQILLAWVLIDLGVLTICVSFQQTFLLIVGVDLISLGYAVIIGGVRLNF